MATFQKFTAFVNALAEGVHNLAADQLAVALTNTAPSPLDETLADIAEIDYTNLSSRDFVTLSAGQTAGIYALALENLELKATGRVGPFKWLVLFNDTTSDKHLIGFYGDDEEITLTRGGTYLIDFDGRPALTLA